VIAGRGNLAESADATVAAISALAGLDRVRFLVALHRGNVRGALDLGLAPGFLPGRVTLEDGRDWFEDAWGAVPGEVGLDGLGILRAAADGNIGALVLLGADPHDDCPDRALASAGVTGARFVIAVDTFLTDSTRRADVFLPVTMWGEQDGTVSNLEGRVQRVARKVSPDGTAMPDWRIAAELALRLREDFDLATSEEVQDEIARVAPAFAGVTSTLVQRARDGVVLPIAEHPDEIVLRRLSIPLTDASWEPIVPGRIDGPDDLAAPDEDPGAEVATADTADTTGADADGADVPDDADVPAPDAPALHRFTGGGATPDRPGRDAYALRLVSSRVLYDGGVMASATPAFAPLVRAGELRVHHTDRDRIGVADDDVVRVTSAHGQLDLPVRADDTVPAGTAVLAWNLPDRAAATLVDASAAVTDLRVESVR
jgi:NADH-quinone oxidoreductase subunit G